MGIRLEKFCYEPLITTIIHNYLMLVVYILKGFDHKEKKNTLKNMIAIKNIEIKYAWSS